tara:strand:- start:146 stop:811 length:666 start_codon:yes stop_codon:yes gene_type:complete
MNNIFVVIEGERRGPLTPSELRELLKAGQIQPDTPALREGDEKWSTVGLFAKITDAAPLDPESTGSGLQSMASISRDFKNVKQNSSVTVDELRTFMREMRGKTPREMLGAVAQSSLVSSTLVSSGIIILLLVVLTVAPYTYGIVKKGAEVKAVEVEEKPENKLESKTMGKEVNVNPPEKTPAVPVVTPPDVLGVNTEKTGKPTEVNPFENNDDPLGEFKID